MKSYKDIDREIILNAPEGAMWYNYKNDMYYTYNGEGVVYFSHSGKWSESSAWFDLSKITEGPDAGDLIPLPNIEIPWEATADSECPVPRGIFGHAQYKCEEGMDEYYNPTMELGRCNSEWSLVGSGSTSIISYKIIDEDYLKPIQEEPINVPELEMHRAAYQAIKDAGFESPEELLAEHLAFIDSSGGHTDYEVLTSEQQLTNNLKFLQNLANQFPEIRNEAIKFMECELDGYMNTLWEKDNDE